VPLPRNRQQKLCRCRSRNRQRRWSRFSLALFFFWVFTISYFLLPLCIQHIFSYFSNLLTCQPKLNIHNHLIYKFTIHL
jgi:hypothetical protein